MKQLSHSFRVFQNAGYQGLYGGLDVKAIKTRKGLDKKEEVLDRMGLLTGVQPLRELVMEIPDRVNDFLGNAVD